MNSSFNRDLYSSVISFFCVTVLLRCNSYTIKSIHLSVQFSGFSMFTEVYSHYHYLIFKKFQFLMKKFHTH